jgi:hypothetical protein
MPATAADWGSLKGRFVYDGPPPDLAPLQVNKDAFCIANPPPNESLIVSDGGGLANVVLFLRSARGKKLEAHPDYAASLDEPAVLNNRGCEFHPHVLLMQSGQKLVVKNSDPVGHNTKIDFGKNSSFNQIIAIDAEMAVSVSKPEAVPAPVQCSIHPWMSGFIVVNDNPYMASSGEDGTFEISNIPAGQHEFVFWHEGPKYLNGIKVGGSQTRRGRAKLKIEAGKTLDLGEIKLSASALH